MSPSPHQGEGAVLLAGLGRAHEWRETSPLMGEVAGGGATLAERRRQPAPDRRAERTGYVSTASAAHHHLHAAIA